MEGAATNIDFGRRLVIAVDLTPLRPGGANGGIKPALFGMLAEAVRQQPEALVFLYLTNSATHEEVRRFSRPQDLLVCVLEEPESPLQLPKSPKQAEFKLGKPPGDFVRRIGADVLYCPFGAATFHTPGVPTVALIADLLQRDYPLTLNAAQVTEREAYIARTVQNASAIQCISRSGVERMIEHYQVPEEKLFYTYLPVQVRLDADPLSSRDFVRQSGIGAPYFFYPANLWKHKNHETLLLAYRLYRERVGNEAWDLALTFHEDNRAAEIRELAEALGIASHMHCPGYVPEAGLRALWQGAGALVFPSLHEGFGIPLVEAMHYGVPVITGLDFSLKEIAGDACYGVDARKPESLAEAMSEVSRDPALREALIARGRQRIQFYDLAVETRKLIDVWRALPQRAPGFPRKPRVLEHPYVLAAPTPASDDLWDFEVRVNPRFPQNRYSLFLDECAYGSFSCTLHPDGIFHFACRPRSRSLRVVISRDRTVPGKEAPALENALEAVSSKNAKGETISLFRNAMEVLR